MRKQQRINGKYGGPGRQTDCHLGKTHANRQNTNKLRKNLLQFDNMCAAWKMRCKLGQHNTLQKSNANTDNTTQYRNTLPLDWTTMEMSPVDPSEGHGHHVVLPRFVKLAELQATWQKLLTTFKSLDSNMCLFCYLYCVMLSAFAGRFQNAMHVLLNWWRLFSFGYWLV